MLNYNDNDQTLMDFYKVLSLEPDSLQDFVAYKDETLPPDNIDGLASDDYYAILNQFLASQDGSGSYSSYRFSDEEHVDPLTGKDLVDHLLRKGVIGSASDPELADFLVSSQKFNSQAYLSKVHRDTPMEMLVSSLNMLDRSIRSQTSQLKTVLDENYVSFVDCKKSIDEVLVAFKKSKSKAQKESEKSKVFNPNSKLNTKLLAGDSLSSELEESINNLNLSSSLIIRPILEHSSREAKVARLIEFIEKNRFFFNLPNELIGYLTKRDQDLFIDNYNKYLKEKEYLEHRREQAFEKARRTNDPQQVKNVEQEYGLYYTALLKVFRETEKIASEYRKKAFRDLLSIDHEVTAKGRAAKTSLDIKFIDLVEKLHRLDKDSKVNPIYEFLSGHLKRLRRDLEYQDEKFQSKFSTMQKKLLDYIASLADQREGGSYVRYIKDKFENVEETFRASSASKSINISEASENIIVEVFENSENLDLSIVNETWLVLLNYVKYLEDFFKNVVSKFAKNYTHYTTPANGPSVDPQATIQKAYFELVNDVIAGLQNIFRADANVEQLRVTPANYSTFLPYHSNSLSTIFYLTDISTRLITLLTTIAEQVAQIGNTNKSPETNKQVKMLREVAGTLDQRILEAICATWVNDCSQFYDLEYWEKYNILSQSRETVYTKLMQVLQYYERYVLRKLAQLVFDRLKLPESEFKIVPSYPSKRTLVSLEIQFMRSINVLMDSIMKKFTAEKAAQQSADYYGAHDIETDIYKILTMNNFQSLGDFIFPSLIKRFDQLFEKSLSKQNLKFYADLDKVKLTVLDEINEHEKAWIEQTVFKHFENLEICNKEDVVEVDPFVYACLVHFVKLVYVVKPITANETFVNMIHELQNHFFKLLTAMVKELKEKHHVIVRILGNLRLDLDFFIDVFEQSDSLRLNDYCLSLGQIVVKDIKECEQIFSDLNYDEKLLQVKLDEAIENSRKEFACFV